MRYQPSTKAYRKPWTVAWTQHSVWTGLNGARPFIKDHKWPKRIVERASTDWVSWTAKTVLCNVVIVLDYLVADLDEDSGDLPT